MTTPWSVPRDWVGETVAVLASGPSMSAEVAEAVRGRCRVIAINNQGIDTVVAGVVRPALAPWADMLYAADLKWWTHYAETALKFAGDKVTVRDVFPHPAVLSLRPSEIRKPYDERPTYVVTGGNSGYQATHIAAQRGASRILLCGFDMREVGRSKHWFGDYPGALNTKQNYASWIRQFALLNDALAARGVALINCTPGSALQGVRRARLEEVLDA